MENDLFLRACRMEKVERTPIWLMRQAGRYIPKYREIRKTRSMMEICKDPDLSAEVSSMPVDMFGVDAAIIFEDLMTPLVPSGIRFCLVDKIGPVIKNPVANINDVDRLGDYAMDELGFVADTIKLLKGRVDVPVIGFAGGPFTISCYLIDGSRSDGFAKTIWMMNHKPDVFKVLMDKLTDIIIRYLKLQVGSGVDAVQVFDTWCGMLDVDAYRSHVAQNSKRIFEALSAMKADMPKVHFALDSARINKHIASLGCDVMSIDWRSSIENVRKQIGPSMGIQGNLDPAILAEGGKRMVDSATEILKSAEGSRGYIFNLGHGVWPNTDPRDVKRLVELVHSSGNKG